MTALEFLARWVDHVPAAMLSTTGLAAPNTKRKAAGRQGMVVAAKTLALSGLDLLNDPKLIEAARADFSERRAGFDYRSRIPANQKPPLKYRDK
jgi:hypothetical protein